MTEKYDLTPAQKIHFFSSYTCPHMELLNIGTSLTIKEDIDFDLLREAIRQAVMRNDALHVQICKTRDGQVKQYINKKQPIEVEFHDFSQGTMEEAEEEMKRWTSEPFELYNSKLYRIVMISMPDGYKGTYFNVQHMIMDSYGIVIFSRDIIEIYAHLRYNMEYPKKLRAYADSLKADLEYLESKKYKDDEAFWEKELSRPEPKFTGLLGSGLLKKQQEENNNPNQRWAAVIPTTFKASNIKFHMQTEPTEQLLDFCSEHNVPLVCLLLMSLRLYLSKFNDNEEDVSVKSTVSRRATVTDKKSAGTRVHFFPCRMDMPNSLSVMEGLRRIQEIQNKIFRHANYDPVKLLMDINKRYNVGQGGCYENLTLTYQPLTMKQKDERLDNINYKSRWYPNGVAAQAVYLTVMHDPQDNGLDFYFEYQFGDFNEQNLEYIYYYLGKIMFAIAQHPEKTMQEIIDEV